jgi:hypothetical protein
MNGAKNRGRKYCRKEYMKTVNGVISDTTNTPPPQKLHANASGIATMGFLLANERPKAVGPNPNSIDRTQARHIPNPDTERNAKNLRLAGTRYNTSPLLPGKGVVETIYGKGV